jgi:pyrrolysine biosynthesis protein PylC
VREFEQLALRLANRLQLRGLMDVEVILNDGILKILEIDARLPSQTPTAVYWSTGYNLVVALGEVFIDRRACPMTHRPGRSVVYEHVHAQAGRLIWGGEHLMAAAGRLHRQAGFFGADEALTDYDSNQMEWRATLIFSADHRDAVWAKRRQWIDTIQRCLGLKPEFDSSSRERGQDSHDPVMCR